MRAPSLSTKVAGSMPVRAHVRISHRLKNKGHNHRCFSLALSLPLSLKERTHPEGSTYSLFRTGLCPTAILGEGQAVPSCGHHTSSLDKWPEGATCSPIVFSLDFITVLYELNIVLDSYLLLLGTPYTPGVEGSSRGVDKGWCELRCPEWATWFGDFNRLLARHCCHWPMRHCEEQDCRDVTRSLCCASKSCKEFCATPTSEPRAFASGG